MRVYLSFFDFYFLNVDFLVIIVFVFWGPQRDWKITIRPRCIRWKHAGPRWTLFNLAAHAQNTKSLAAHVPTSLDFAAHAQCFFLPEKKKLNPRTISIFCPRSSQTGREKNLENRPRKKFVPKKKQQNSTRKKNSLPEKNILSFPVQMEKIPWNSWISARERKKIIPRKNLKMCPRKLQTAREK